MPMHMPMHMPMYMPMNMHMPSSPAALLARVAQRSYEHWWCHKHHLKWKFTTGFIKVSHR